MKTEEFILSQPFNRLNDVYFKSVIASPERKHITIAFLNAVMSHVYPGRFPEIVDVEFLDREPSAKWEGEKVPRFDVFPRGVFREKTIDARLFHLEVQDARDRFFLKRGFFYTCHDYAGQSRRGLHYKDFEPVVFVGLLNFCISEESDSLREWHNLHKVLNTATHDCEFDLMDIHFAELPLLRRKWRRLKHKPSTQFEELMFYFGNVGGKNMGEALVQEIAERNPVVADLLDYEREFRTDPLVMRQYIFAERAHHDYLANLELEREEGIEVGIEQGIEKGRKEGLEAGIAKGYENNIRTIRAKGIMTDEQIADMLDLPLDFVKNA